MRYTHSYTKLVEVFLNSSS